MTMVKSGRSVVTVDWWNTPRTTSPWCWEQASGPTAS